MDQEEGNAMCRLVLGVGLVLALTSAACDRVPGASPVSPSGVSSLTANFNGLYSGAMVLTRVSGGECVGADLSGDVGSQDAGTVAVTQVDDELTAVVRSASTGLRCTYTGKASFATFAAHFQSCDATEILFACTSGQVRILTLVGSTITATVAGTGTQGVVTTSYNVYSQSPGQNTRTPVGGLVTEQTFLATRR
jgi:hypothetical protein